MQARRDAERAEEEAWRRRVDADVAQLRVTGTSCGAKTRNCSSTSRRMAGGDGMEGDVVARAQVQAHAAASAAVVPVQAHLERELSPRRRPLLLLRSGGSFENIAPGDVDEALTSQRPSELLIKGVVAGTVSEAESRLEEKLAKALPVKLQPTLERHAERAAKDAEDQVLASSRRLGRAAEVVCWLY